MRRPTGLAIAIALLLAGCGGSETCTQVVPCGAGSGSYKLCSTGASCRYVTSDGSSFACGACADCTSAATQAAAWCGGFGGDGGSPGSDAGAPVAGCVTATVCASSAKDCAAGQRCNAALSPPICQALYCGAVNSPCGGDSANDLCASRMCGTNGRCVATADLGLPTSSCCAPGHLGNELGVGAYCKTQSDCGAANLVCSTLAGNGADGYCTMACNATTSCGSHATCLAGHGGSACVPTDCGLTGC